MALTIYNDSDCKTKFIQSKSIGIIGFGAQGQAQAQNLKDSGYQVKIGLKNGSKSADLARQRGFEVYDIITLAQTCEILVFLLPDEWHKEAFTLIAPFLKPKQVLIFSHGFSIHFQEIIPPSFIDVILVAPKAAGHAVRSEFLKGRGVIALIGIHQDFSTHAKEIALEYACALGCGKSGIFESNFEDECVCDLFSEQSVICGGVDALIRAGFETLTEAGYPPEIAYFECLHEVKLVIDLIYAHGLEGMRKHISNTAEYGDITSGETIITQESKNTMKQILCEIQNGNFAQKFLKERDLHFPTLEKERKKLRESEIEIVGAKMRKMMPWLK